MQHVKCAKIVKFRNPVLPIILKNENFLCQKPFLRISVVLVAQVDTIFENIQYFGSLFPLDRRTSAKAGIHISRISG